LHHQIRLLRVQPEKAAHAEGQKSYAKNTVHFIAIIPMHINATRPFHSDPDDHYNIVNVLGAQTRAVSSTFH
jgi:hypothetical protein